LRPRDWYEGNDITCEQGPARKSVDERAHRSHLRGNGTTYDHFAFTTGSHPRTLPAAIGGELDGGVFTVRDLADADALKPEFVAGRRLL
jgi:3-phenylpropionate/trans-cinnamate dioxygenase ferredoxin reductase subunit